MIERINQISVSKEDLIEVVEELEPLNPSDRGWETSIATIVRLQNRNHDKVGAIMFQDGGSRTALGRRGCA